MKEKTSPKLYLALHLLIAVFSLSTVCSKMAAKQTLLSPMFFLFYGLVLFLLMVYAVCWQQIIKRMPLTTAYANKAVTVIWGLIWGIVLFNEKITLGKLIGAGVIILGIILFALAEVNPADKPKEKN
ncbi:DMT family transporter [Pygmaiobacter massiliensis]|uniref:DMT family transporter n=1 Tax=Pygmaiobacter massiliensis TaxID=1917873 RepID=UPI00289EBF01|nr:EamA family transporter [Pygmaiobacter massiliensis]